MTKNGKIKKNRLLKREKKKVRGKEKSVEKEMEKRSIKEREEMTMMTGDRTVTVESIIKI